MRGHDEQSTHMFSYLSPEHGMPSKHVAHTLDTSQDTVRLWRRRFAAGGPEALTRDAPGRGRKRQITAARERQVVAAPLHTAPARATHWSLRSMAAAQGLSPASIHRTWDAHGLQPHRVRTFKLSTDPAFVEKSPARLTDYVTGYQVLAGAEYQLNDPITLGLTFRRVDFGRFESTPTEWNQLRSHDSTVGRDERILYQVTTDDSRFWDVSLSLRYQF